MKSAPYSREEAEQLAEQVNKLSGQPLYKGMHLVIDRAFAYPFGAHPPLMELFKNFSETGRPLADILADRKEQYTQFDVALIYKDEEEGDDEPLCQNISMFISELRDRV